METKPFYLSLSFWGIALTMLNPIIAHFHIVLDPNTLAQLIVGTLTGAVGIYGVLRRKDIHVVPPSTP